MAKAMKRLVFVYGTLRKGGRLHSYMENSALVGRAKVAESTLFSLGSFPGAHFGNGQHAVLGEVYEVDKATLDKLDSLEGYYENRPEISMYTRRRVQASTEFDHVEAWAYEYRGNAREPIKSGDWIEHTYYRTRRTNE